MATWMQTTHSAAAPFRSRPATTSSPPPTSPDELRAALTKISNPRRCALARQEPGNQRRSCSTPWHVVERHRGTTGSHRALRARDGSRRGRRGRPLPQTPLLVAADSKRRNRPGIRGLLLVVPEASVSAAAAMRLTRFTARPHQCSPGRLTTRLKDTALSWAPIPGSRRPAETTGDHCRGAAAQYRLDRVMVTCDSAAHIADVTVERGRFTAASDATEPESAECCPASPPSHPTRPSGPCW
jgi:hypothetical protein